MVNLDDLPMIKKLDASNVYASVEQLAKQCFHAWEDTKNITVPVAYKDVEKILMTGMGGSGLGARIIESVYGPRLRFPLVRLNDYDLPDWVDEKTLVICSSFSGTTEETILNANQATERRAKWMAIGAGGRLIDMAEKAGVPYYRIVPTYNPSNQPRLAIGYSVIGQLVLVSKTGLIPFSEEDVKLTTNHLKSVVGSLNVSVSGNKNPAKKLAQQMEHKKVIFVAGRHLVAAAHTAKNQMNENAKHFCALFEIPELNHHLMEGLKFPIDNKNDLLFVFVASDLYPQRIQQRFKITQDVVEKNGIETAVWKPESNNPLSQAFEFIQFAAFVNFYLSMLHELDPAPIPWVDYFKTELGQPLGK